MHIICIDLESTLTPEIWVEVSDKTKIKELGLTTRDIPDYDLLMKKRLKVLKENNLKLRDIQKIIEKIKPIKGAPDFLNWIRRKTQVIILSDTFVEFGNILMEKFNYPTLFCNNLKIDKKGFIINYESRNREGKMETVKALQSLNFKVVAIGDSYNDIAMLKKANAGFLFKAPNKIKKEFPQFSNAQNYKELKNFLKKYV